MLPNNISLLIFNTDALEDDASILDMASFNRTHYLTTFKQRFENDKPEKEILLADKYWTKSIPHEQSGPCETYDPPFDSGPGYDISMFFTLKELDTNLEMFLHKKGKFFYSKNPMSQKRSKYIDLEEIKKKNYEHTRIVGMRFNPNDKFIKISIIKLIQLLYFI